jgi:hypothetical protein
MGRAVSVTDIPALSRRWQVQPPVPACLTEGCEPFDGPVCNADGAHKAAFGHTAATGHETRVTETSLAIYTRTEGK